MVLKPCAQGGRAEVPHAVFPLCWLPGWKVLSSVLQELFRGPGCTLLLRGADGGTERSGALLKVTQGGPGPYSARTTTLLVVIVLPNPLTLCPA